MTVLSIAYEHLIEQHGEFLQMIAEKISSAVDWFKGKANELYNAMLECLSPIKQRTRRPCRCFITLQRLRTKKEHCRADGKALAKEV